MKLFNKLEEMSAKELFKMGICNEEEGMMVFCKQYNEKGCRKICHYSIQKYNNIQEVNENGK